TWLRSRGSILRRTISPQSCGQSATAPRTSTSIRSKTQVERFAVRFRSSASDRLFCEPPRCPIGIGAAPPLPLDPAPSPTLAFRLLCFAKETRNQRVFGAVGWYVEQQRQSRAGPSSPVRKTNGGS